MLIPICSNPIAKDKAKQMNPLVLAFVGDSVQALYVRSTLSVSSTAKAGALHVQSAKKVCAGAQAEQADRLTAMLTDEERDIFHRARNSKSAHHAKNFEVIDYHKASGLEAVMGYLYLVGDIARLETLITAMEGI